MFSKAKLINEIKTFLVKGYICTLEACMFIMMSVYLLTNDTTRWNII